MVKTVQVVPSNQSEAVSVVKKKLEYKWGMNVLGELVKVRVERLLLHFMSFFFLLETCMFS